MSPAGCKAGEIRTREPRKVVGQMPPTLQSHDYVSVARALRYINHHLGLANIPGLFLALGHVTDRFGLEVLQLASDGVFWGSQLTEDGRRVRGRHHDGKSPIRPGDTAHAVWLWPGRCIEST